MQPTRQQLVFNERGRCRVCFTCVRECPVKAIRIYNGQAQVINERCIACGNCVKVCSQQAKKYLDNRSDALALLESGEKVVAMVAPSFPAEFKEIDDHRKVVGMIRQLGFYKVVEVAFGADLVSKEYKKLLNTSDVGYITSDCPAVVNYLQLYHPALVKYLAPIASPMLATARVVRQKYGEDVKTVFIGPCIAKKSETGEVDAALTFRELRNIFWERGIFGCLVQASEFDPPNSGKGSIFPVSRGLLHNVNHTDDIADGDFIVAEGKTNFRDAIREFENGNLGSQHLELLCCEGCIMGAGMTERGKRYSRRTNIKKYVKNKLEKLDEVRWQREMEEFADLDLSRQFEACGVEMSQPDQEAIDRILREMGKFQPQDHLNCGACGYDTCEEHAYAIYLGLAETEMCLPYTISKLHNNISELNETNERLANAKHALRQSEKLASMGQLSAGIAHELNNPLGVITMYSNILLDETNPGDPIRKDLELIVEQSDRCKTIVSGLLNFARKNQVNLVRTDLNAFVQRSLNSVIVPPGIRVNIGTLTGDPVAMIDQEQMIQVLTNLERNAIEAMPEQGLLNIALEGNDREVQIRISDTGTGISDENKEKLFTPFFTTKEPGKGTGLGLPLVYGIVKMHRGKISVNSNTDPAKGPTGTEFIITLPRNDF